MSGTQELLQIYTDGSARGNPGRGGYGVILHWKNTRKELSAGFRYTTNNRMELLAVIVALEQLNRFPLQIVITTDSKYVAEAIEKMGLWLGEENFKDKNPDLWKRFLPLYRKHQVSMHWVKGHAQHPENNRCDELATLAADHGPWEIDAAYEAENPCPR
ncbi:MAG: ribonuclease HI [Bacteroidota bacterium]|nr:MAG: ribonuclease HI [Bacteroidota bacterium]